MRSDSERKYIKLRGHHLICLNFFSGEGYDIDFIKNLEYVVERINMGVVIKLVEGADDICERCSNLKGGMCYYKQGADDGIRRMDSMAMDLLGVQKGQELLWDQIKKRLPLVMAKWRDVFCNCCEWKYVCEKKEFYL
jgi:hypothetical protein